MSPGIVDADLNIKKDDQVWVCDVRNKKPLAVGCALMDGSDMIKENKGKSVKIVHYVGDKYWDLSKI
jgi:PUA domain protein